MTALCGIASSALAATDSFSSNPGFSVVSQVAAGVTCEGGWNAAEENVFLSLVGSGDGTVQACALQGAAVPQSGATDPFVFAFDYYLPVAPSGDLAVSAPSVTLASTANWNPLGNYLGSALRFDLFNLGGVFALYLSTSDADLDPLPNFVATGVNIDPGRTYHIQARYLPDTSSLEFEASDADTGEVVKNGTVADFVLLADFDRYFVSAGAYGANIQTSAVIDNVSFEGPEADALAVSIDVMPGRRRSCLPEGSRSEVSVAVLGSSGFAVADVDLESLSLAPFVLADGGKRHDKSRACRVRDLDQDGNPDLLCKFRGRAEAGADPSMTLSLNGVLFDGTEFTGSDTVCTSEARRGRGRGKDHERHDDDHDHKGKKGKKDKKGKKGKDKDDERDHDHDDGDDYR
ncbi:MAG TPA: hypothetical protein VLA56_02385 [Pseudomonadales bacterium]|nr:hypothetical protein [Pseudomonadales bacterium]